MGHSPRRGFAADVASADLIKRGVIDSKSVNDKKVLGSLPLPLTGSKGVGTAKGKNFVRNKKMFKNHAKGLICDRKFITRYQKMLREQYVIALQMQLKGNTRGTINGARTRYAKIGYATGRLYKGIKAKAVVTVKHEPKKGRYNIYYKIDHDYSHVVGENGYAYGDSLRDVRPPKKKTVNWEVILKWMKTKGSMFKALNESNTDSNAKDKKKKEKSVAFAIAIKLSRETNPPVLKDWSVWDKNKKLRSDFKRLTKYKGIHHRKQIRKSIMRNITKTNI